MNKNQKVFYKRVKPTKSAIFSLTKFQMTYWIRLKYKNSYPMTLIRNKKSTEKKNEKEFKNNK